MNKENLFVPSRNLLLFVYNNSINSLKFMSYAYCITPLFSCIVTNNVIGALDFWAYQYQGENNRSIYLEDKNIEDLDKLFRRRLAVTVSPTKLILKDFVDVLRLKGCNQCIKREWGNLRLANNVELVINLNKAVLKDI